MKLMTSAGSGRSRPRNRRWPPRSTSLKFSLEAQESKLRACITSQPGWSQVVKGVNSARWVLSCGDAGGRLAVVVARTVALMIVRRVFGVLGWGRTPDVD